jgi:elongation factor G
MDRIGASYTRTVNMIRERLGAQAVAIQVPIGVEDQFKGVVDLITRRAYIWEDRTGSSPVEIDIPKDLAGEVEAARMEMVEAIAESDEELTLKFLEEAEISEDELKLALRQAVIQNKLTPVLCGSSLISTAVQPLLDAVVDYLPSPLDIPPVEGADPKTGEPLTRSASDEEPLSALVFKIVTDPYVGRLAYIRIYSGVIEQGATVFNPGKVKRERVGRLIRMYADRREDIEKAGAGDIAAVLGLKNSFTGDTLCETDSQIILENISFPDPVIMVAIEPKTTADQDKLSTALQKLSEEDPTFKVRVDGETGQTLISGMGELHLEVLVDRMLREFKVQARVGRPRVAYKESITRPVDKIDYRHVKQSGGHGQYGHVVLRLEPGEDASGIVFEDEIKGGVIPREYIPAVQKGVLSAAESGVLAGYPVTDVKVTLIDGSFHEVDSSDLAFKMAGSMAFKQGIQKGSPVLQEPIMKVEVVIPEEFLGDIIGQINSRRGDVQGMEALPGGTQAVRAMVPLAEMFGYATELRSATKGRGAFTMEFDHYSKVSEELSTKIIVGG